MKRRFKTLCRSAAPVLAAGMLLIAFTAFKRYLELPPPETYVDQGVHTFTASSGYPTNRQGHYQKKYHRYSERHVYVVVYQAAGGWRWERDFLAEAAGKEAVRDREQVQRRVLSLAGENRYITVEPELTPQRYVERYQRFDLIVGGGCLAVLAVEGTAFLLLRRRKQNRGKPSV